MFHISGCEENWNSDSYSVYPKCPEEEPFCNKESRLCQATPGSILLNKIVIKTKDCKDCDPKDDGVSLTLTGTDLMMPEPQCSVNNNQGLHHPDVPDFYNNSITVFETTSPYWHANSRDASFGWGGCWKVNSSALETQFIFNC